MFSQDRRQPEGRGHRPVGLGPHKGCHVGRGRLQFHKRNTFQQTESRTSSRGFFVMRNCVPSSTPSPSVAPYHLLEIARASQSAFKAPFIALRASLLPLLSMSLFLPSQTHL